MLWTGSSEASGNVSGNKENLSQRRNLREATLVTPFLAVSINYYSGTYSGIIRP
jgi:hypothetical protein